MKNVVLNGHEIVICNCGGTYYAIQRRCGHMNAPLEMGTLDGKFVTCGMHCAQFDVTTGQALSGPVPEDLGNETFRPEWPQCCKTSPCRCSTSARNPSALTRRKSKPVGSMWRHDSQVSA
jgi:nitrite reductase/ring-hydroxylating ferredoxin subunit